MSNQGFDFSKMQLFKEKRTKFNFVHIFTKPLEGILTKIFGLTSRHT